MSNIELIPTMGHEQVVFCNDASTGLRAIIAIHNTVLGPALGGTRMWPYASDEEALKDVLRLSRGMTYKAAVAGLTLGGGKAVIIGDPKIKTPELFQAFGRFVETLGGRYITAEDVNIKPEDMENVRKETEAVTGLLGKSGDPSPVTAMGTFVGIKAAVKHQLGKDSLEGIRVAVQGLGAVGSNLCEDLHQAGAKLVVADIKPEKVNQMVERFNAKVADVTDIHASDVDVFAPCALGAIINDKTIPELKATIVAGAANNQLQNEDVHGKVLKDKNILYAPDYVINAGGLINVYNELTGYDAVKAKAKAAEIYNTLTEVFQTSAEKNIPTHEASDTIAEKRIAAADQSLRLKQSYYKADWVKRN